jgi:hypothetical protein
VSLLVFYTQMVSKVDAIDPVFVPIEDKRTTSFAKN